MSAQIMVEEVHKETRSNVYEAINRVQADLAKVGISKDQKNQQQGYKFRGIDDLYNTLSPIMSKHGLVIVPKVTSRDMTERTTQKGGVLFYVNVTVDYSLVSAADGSTHVATIYGEAMDSGDKATNKALSAAYKYLCLQTFCIPTEGDNDADATTHEVAPKKAFDRKSLAGLDIDDPDFPMREMAIRGALAKFNTEEIDIKEAKALIEDAVRGRDHKETNEIKLAIWKRFDASERNALQTISGVQQT